MRRQPSVQQLHFPSVVRAPFVAQAPPVLPSVRPPAQHRTPMASYLMTDLREEINRRQGGKDNRTTVERHRERRRDIEGRNLEKDFDLHAPVGGRHVTHAPLPAKSLGVLGGGGAWHWPHTYVWWSGCASFGLTYQRSETGRLTPPSSYRSTPAPSSLEGGIEAIMANYFPVALTGTTKSWLMNLPKGSLDS
jgi:hypothetical protein